MSSDSQTHDIEETWPPGTVRLQDLSQYGNRDDTIILHPKPTNDPNDPLNWRTWEKTLNYSLTMLYVIIQYGIIDATTPTWGPMVKELGFSYAVLFDSYAAGSATLCIGALLFIPFAVKFGRRPVYIISLIFQLLVSVWSAEIHTVADLISTQALNCMFGAVAEVIVQMTIADVYFVHQRGFYSNVYVCATIGSASLAPVAAGYATFDLGWRWVWWILAIIIGAGLVSFVLLYEETKYSPAVDGISPSSSTAGKTTSAVRFSVEKDRFRDNKDKAPYLETTDTELQLYTSQDAAPRVPRKTYFQRLSLISTSPGSWKQLCLHIVQPLQILFTTPAVLYAGLVYGILTAGLQVILTVIATYMIVEPYNFSPANIGLISGIPMLVGSLVGGLISAPLSDRAILYLARRNRGVYEPEMRLYLLVLFAPFVPAGLLTFGYCLGNGSPWPVVAIACGLFSFGFTPVAGFALTYITDAYTDIISDAMVGVIFLRNAIATIFVATLTPWVQSTSLQQMILVLAIISIVIFLMTACLIYRGKAIRARLAERYSVYASRQVDSRNYKS